MTERNSSGNLHTWFQKEESADSAVPPLCVIGYTTVLQVGLQVQLITMTGEVHNQSTVSNVLEKTCQYAEFRASGMFLTAQSSEPAAHIGNVTAHIVHCNSIAVLLVP